VLDSQLAGCGHAGCLSMRLIRTVLVDDQPLARTGLRRILCPEEGFDVVAECSDGAQVSSTVAHFRPDLVVMDVRMSVVNGAEATRRLRQMADPPPVLVLTTFGEDEVLAASLRAGAAGFLLKDAPGEEIISAARLVSSGEGYLDPSVTLRVLNDYRPADASINRSRVERLTERELEILRLVARGLSNDEIASRCHISEATVKTHVGRVLAKVDVRDRAGLVVYAFDHGFVRPGDGQDL
jgi:DNA-binding NarL/FixJ family response regulator